MKTGGSKRGLVARFRLGEREETWSRSRRRSSKLSASMEESPKLSRKKNMAGSQKSERKICGGLGLKATKRIFWGEFSAPRKERGTEFLGLGTEKLAA